VRGAGPAVQAQQRQPPRRGLAADAVPGAVPAMGDEAFAQFRSSRA
jgi:hypothetical protein